MMGQIDIHNPYPIQGYHVIQLAFHCIIATTQLWVVIIGIATRLWVGSETGLSTHGLVMNQIWLMSNQSHLSVN